MHIARFIPHIIGFSRISHITRLSVFKTLPYSCLQPSTKCSHFLLDLHESQSWTSPGSVGDGDVAAPTALRGDPKTLSTLETIVAVFGDCHRKGKNGDKLSPVWTGYNGTQSARSGKRGYAQNPLHTFPRNFPVDEEAANLLRTCCRLVSDTANKSTTSCCNGIWETTRHDKKTQRTFAAPTCYGLATGKLA